MRNSFIPQETYSRIADISLEYLDKDKDIKGLIFDFDGTLKRDKKLSKDTIEFIKKAKDAGFKISILSNNFFLNPEMIEDLGIYHLSKVAFKPLKKPFLDMAERMKLPPERIAVIGNNRFTDIWGANRANMFSILIQNFNSFFFKNGVENKLKDRGIKHVD